MVWRLRASFVRRGYHAQSEKFFAICGRCFSRRGLHRLWDKTRDRSTNRCLKPARGHGGRASGQDGGRARALPAVLDVVKGTPYETPARRQLEGRQGFPVEAERVADMDKDGIDVQVLSINAFWYAADRDLARRIFDLQSEKLADV